MRAKGWTQSELARQVGVSRQAVSLWLQRDHVTVRSEHLLGVGAALGVSAESLARPLPGYGHDRARLRGALLWDRLYVDLADFAIAVNRWEPAAVARLVQVCGLYAAERAVGVRAWRTFDSYKHLIHPVRRRQLETLVRWRKTNPTTN